MHDGRTRTPCSPAAFSCDSVPFAALAFDTFMLAAQAEHNGRDKAAAELQTELS